MPISAPPTISMTYRAYAAARGITVASAQRRATLLRLARDQTGQGQPALVHVPLTELPSGLRDDISPDSQKTLIALVAELRAERDAAQAEVARLSTEIGGLKLSNSILQMRLRLSKRRAA